MTEEEAKQITDIIHDIRNLEMRLVRVEEIINDVRKNEEKLIDKLYDYVLIDERSKDSNGRT